ncbi:hypothetical protein FIV36_23830 [Pseudomonas extremaustralis]|uniref:Uncharacterized protein n=1 Tax=Pseudomonas extremaustralis TaxID=359110 RepID=A0A5C5Q7E6_9PSED|nr:hypothetical protein FIV36_23830 [Pseudomonas extremaustralis]
MCKVKWAAPLRGMKKSATERLRHFQQKLYTINSTDLFPSATATPVGASLPAKIANADAYILNECSVLESFASKLAPTDDR